MADKAGIDYSYKVIGQDVTRDWVLENFPLARTTPLVVIGDRWGGSELLEEHIQEISNV